MIIPFTTFFQRLTQATDIKTQMDLAAALGLNRSAITQSKIRDAVPQKWILALARHYTLSPDWLEFGTGTPYPAKPTPAAETKVEQAKSVGTVSLRSGQQQRRPGRLLQPMDAVENAPVVYVPKVQARLCAGGGSFEVEAMPVSGHPFPYQWLARMGTPSAMVFMDVMGDSMEPGIRDGDTVLVDQNGTQITSHAVMAVGVEDSIYLKRVERRNNGIILQSDNPAYPDMELYGDEIDTFRIIGKVVWLCRDCRYY